jgi:hypothetical protein
MRPEAPARMLGPLSCPATAQGRPKSRPGNCEQSACSIHCVTPSAATQLASLGDSGGHLRPRLRVVTCCLVIRTAVTILLGISVATVRVVAVRLRLIYMLEHDRRGGVTFQLAAPEIRARPVPWPRRLDTVKAAKSFPGRRPDLVSLNGKFEAPFQDVGRFNSRMCVSRYHHSGLYSRVYQ